MSHGSFLLPLLRPDHSVLDCGCGPGSLTCDIAQRLETGTVVGVDSQASQVQIAMVNAEARGLDNVVFRQASAYELPFAEGFFDVVFAHALMEHLKEPARAIAEFYRVLRPGGVLAVCSPDWGGFLLAPPSDPLTWAIEAYKALQIRNGGDVYVGRKLSALFDVVGFENIQMQARYEVYDSLSLIGDYLALQLEGAGEALHAVTLREWAKSPHGMFAQAWVSCTGWRPLGY